MKLRTIIFLLLSSIGALGAAIPGSIPITGPVAPTDTEDTYPSHLALYGKGGFRTVADQAERDAIPSARREEGMLVWVGSERKLYALSTNLTSWAERRATLAVDTVSDLSSLDTTLIASNTVATAAGYAAAGDGGGGTFVWVPGSVATNAPNRQATGGAWLRIGWDGNVAALGLDKAASFSSGGDSAAVVQDILNRWSSANPSGRLFFPQGSYRFTTNLVIPLGWEGVIEGATGDSSATTLNFENTNAPAFRILDGGYHTIRNLSFRMNSTGGIPQSNTNAYWIDNIGFYRHTLWENIYLDKFSGTFKSRLDTSLVPSRTEHASAFNMSARNLYHSGWGHYAMWFGSGGNSGNKFDNVAWRNNVPGGAITDRYTAKGVLRYEGPALNEIYDLLNAEHSILTEPAFQLLSTKHGPFGFNGLHCEGLVFTSDTPGKRSALFQAYEAFIAIRDANIEPIYITNNLLSWAVFHINNPYQSVITLENSKLHTIDNVSTAAVKRVTTSYSMPAIETKNVLEYACEFDATDHGWEVYSARPKTPGAVYAREDFTDLSRWLIGTSAGGASGGAGWSLVTDPSGQGRQGVLKIVTGTNNFGTVLGILTNLNFTPDIQSARMRVTLMTPGWPAGGNRDWRVSIGFGEDWGPFNVSYPTNFAGIALPGTYTTGATNDVRVWQRLNNTDTHATLIDGASPDTWYTVDWTWHRNSNEERSHAWTGDRRVLATPAATNFPRLRTLLPSIYAIHRTDDAGASGPNTLYIDSIEFWISSGPGHHNP